MNRVVAKLKEKTDLILKRGSEIFKDYKLTLFVIVIWTVAFIVNGIIYDLADSFYNGEMPEHVKQLVTDAEYATDLVFRFATMLGFGTLFLEIRYENRKKKLLLCIPVSLLSAALACLIQYGSYAVEEAAQNDMVGYLLIMSLLIVYAAYRRYGHSFSEYMAQIAFYMAVNIAMLIVATIGLCIVWTAASLLLLSDDYYYWGSSMCFVLALGFVFLPGCIWTLQGRNREYTEAIRRLVIALMAGFSICATAVIYFYVLKIIITWNPPSNEIYSVMANLFAFSVPIWLMSRDEEGQNVWSKVLLWLPCTYAPLIILQVYSMGVRIARYGLTPERYAGVMLILFEVIAVFVCTFKKRHCDKLFLIGAGIVFVAVFLPLVNMYYLSAKSQKAVLDGYVEKLKEGKILTEEEISRMDSSYRFLKSQYGEEYVEAIYSDEAIFESGNVVNVIEAESVKYHKEYDSVHGCQMVGEMDTDGYSIMNMLGQSAKYDLDEEEGGIPVVFSAFQFNKRESGEEVVIDLSGFAEKCFAYKKEHPDSNKEEESAYFKQFNRLEIDENTIFYVNHFEVTYYTIGGNYENMEITNVNISGMLLEN